MNLSGVFSGGNLAVIAARAPHLKVAAAATTWLLGCTLMACDYLDKYTLSLLCIMLEAGETGWEEEGSLTKATVCVAALWPAA